MLVPILFLCLITYVNGKVCENNQFWSFILERCESCSECVHPDVTIRPCQRYMDTVCGPLSELNIDWTWLRNQGGHTTSTSSKDTNLQKEMLETFKENFNRIRQHEKHVREKEKQKSLRRKHNKDSDESSQEIEGGDIFVGDRYKFKKGDSEKDIWKKLTLLNRHENLEDKVPDDVSSIVERTGNHLEEPVTTLKTWQKVFRPKSDSKGIGGLHFNDDEALELLKSSRKKDDEDDDDDVEEDDRFRLKFDEKGALIKNFGFTEIEDNVKMEKLVDDSKFDDEFSSTEKFILDWQTVILGIAVSSCVIFFLVAAIYSMQHAKHWKKLKNYFDADVEELQSWISSKNSKSKIPSSGIYKTTTEVVHTEGSQCKYLERIIRMNGKNKLGFANSNVYEKDNKLPSELKPLTKKYPAVHKKMGDRI